jgi:hypothetical protein
MAKARRGTESQLVIHRGNGTQRATTERSYYAVVSVRLLRSRSPHELNELELARLVGFDPRRRLVICATALIGLRETVLGVGAIDLAVDADPWLLAIDDRAAGLGPLLADALLGRALALLQGRAA